MGVKFSNFGKAIIASAPTGTSGLSFTVEAGKGLLFPVLASGDFFYGIFKDASGNREIVKVEARSSDAMTIAAGGRGLDGTTPRTWAAGDYFVAGLTNIILQQSIGSENLNAIASLPSAADRLPYFTGSGTANVTNLTSFARSFLDDINATNALTTLGVSAFAQTILNDGNAATARGTLGAVGYADVLGGTAQAWQNMTGSRSLITTYTNTTGRPIFVAVSATSTVAAGLILAVGTLPIRGSFSSTPGSTLSACGIIPNGSQYAAYVSIGTGTLYSNGWLELR